VKNDDSAEWTALVLEAVEQALADVSLKLDDFERHERLTTLSALRDRLKAELAGPRRAAR
jgi:hypothetical protein